MNSIPLTLTPMSQQDFATFGIDIVAYVKPVDVDGSKSFAIYAADGTPLTVVNERDVAFAAVRQHDMEPLSVH